MFVIFFITVLLLHHCRGQDSFFESCPSHFHGQQNFNLTAAKGKWFEVERFGAIAEYGGSCVRFEFSETEKSDVFITHIYHQHLGGWSKWHTKGTCVYLNAERTADFKMVVQVTPFSSVPVEYTIIDTDYISYAVIWICKDTATKGHKEGLWILSRTTTMSAETKSYLSEKLKSIIGFHPERLTEVDNSKC